MNVVVYESVRVVYAPVSVEEVATVRVFSELGSVLVSLVPTSIVEAAITTASELSKKLHSMLSASNSCWKAGSWNKKVIETTSMLSPVREISPTVRIHSEPSSTIVTWSAASVVQLLRFGKKTAMMLSVIVITGKMPVLLYLSWNWAAKRERQKFNNTLAQSDMRHQVKRAKETY